MGVAWGLPIHPDDFRDRLPPERGPHGGLHGIEAGMGARQLRSPAILGGVQRPPPPPHRSARGPIAQIPRKGRGSHRAPPPPAPRDPPQGAPKRPPRGGGERHRPRPFVGRRPRPLPQGAHPPPPRGLTHPPTPGTRAARAGPAPSSRCPKAGLWPHPHLPGHRRGTPATTTARTWLSRCCAARSTQNPDSGRGPFKWRRRSEPSPRCNPTGGRRRGPIGCAERGTRSHWPRWGLGSRDSFASGCRGNAERSPERGIGATARTATGGWKTWGGSTWRSGSRRAGSTEPGAGDGRGLAGHGGVRGGSTAGGAGRNGAPRFPPVPLRPPAKRGADRTEWARHPAPRPPLNPLAAASPGPSPAVVPGGPVRPHRHGLYLHAGGPTRPNPGAATASPKLERLPGAVSDSAAGRGFRGGPGRGTAPRRDRLAMTAPTRPRRPRHPCPFPPPPVPPALLRPTSLGPPPRGLLCRRDLPPAPSQRGSIAPSAPLEGSAIAPAPGNLRSRSLRAHGVPGLSVGWDPGAQPGAELRGSGHFARAERRPGGYDRAPRGRAGHGGTLLPSRIEPPSPPLRGRVRTTRASLRLDTARSGHEAGGHLEETGSAHAGPAVLPGLRCSLARVEKPSPEPPRCRPGRTSGGAAGRHALGAAAGPLKARGPRTHTPRLRAARGAARGAPFVPRSPLTQAWCPPP
ncbi:basic proline-rich protein-like [Prinia subflava]|uniref:basic proline-rich protein-like n=1 Tax=Prinia subflava TaxID=208062 RepID=UPI002FE3A1D9